MPTKRFEFSISPIIGARRSVLDYLSKNYQVHERYTSKWNKTIWMSYLLQALSVMDKQAYRHKRAHAPSIKEPVFILGHWRSGTTLLHNLICQDPLASYTTTYQSVFPNNLFTSQHVIKPIMKWRLPEKRPADGMRMKVDLPQEEEYALGFETPYSFYYWMLFPQDWESITDQFLLGNVSVKKQVQWKHNYQSFIKRAMLNVDGQRFISKNPAHTARIPMLLELFPDAKFIYIHRNPYEVYRSTLRFHKNTVPALQLQDFSDDIYQNHVLTIYNLLFDKYQKDKSMIPDHNLCELSFEQLVDAPLKTIEYLYSSLKLDGYHDLAKILAPKMEETKNREHHNYVLPPEEITMINQHWGESFRAMGYELQGTGHTA